MQLTFAKSHIKPGLLILFITFFSSVVQADVARSSFTTNIQDREPVDQVYALTDNLKEIFYFTELKNLQGQTITHQWSNAGKASHSVSFDVGANRWRVYSSKTLNKPEGTWTVTVSDANGLILKEESISYGNAGAAENAPENNNDQTPAEANSQMANTSEEESTAAPANTASDTSSNTPDKEVTEETTTDKGGANDTPEANTGNMTADDDAKEDNDKPVWDKL